jgi:hypothetical protein
MLTKFMKRAVIVCAVLTAIVLGVSGTAQAANKTLVLNDIEGNQLGFMTFQDVEPERFRVCDTRNDGYGVTGRVVRPEGTATLTVTANSDSPSCGSMIVQMGAGSHYMQLCWNGPGNICRSVNIR